MLGILANSFMNATRIPDRDRWDAPGHWADGRRFDNRRDAEIEAHNTSRRRD